MNISQLAVASVLAATSLSSKPAHAYDMDCAIMLCMAGGFPSSAVCTAAYAEMIRRITPWPSRPPFGICTYGAVPVALGGAGGSGDLDISTPEFGWLRQTRVLWWSGRSYTSRDDGRLWDWSLRSCDHENSRCQYIMNVSGSDKPWPRSFTSENGQRLQVLGGTNSRAVMMEYSDYNGNLGSSAWLDY